jgi:hypothetical protein
LLLAGSAAVAQMPPSPQEFATAFRNGDYERFKSMIANARMGMLDRAGNVTALSRDDLVERLRACTLYHVYEAGKNYQTLSGADWICRDRPAPGEPCEAVAYGLDLYPVGDRFRVRVYLTTMPDMVACPNRGPAPPARPLRTSH